MFPFVRLAAVLQLCLFAVLTLVPETLFGQAPSTTPSRPHDPHPIQATDQEQIIPYWTTETGWHSELELRNNLASGDIVVTPALRLADGSEMILSPVGVKPQDVRTIDLEQALIGKAPQFIGTFGSVVLRYRSPTVGNLTGMLMIRNVGHSIAFHIDASAEDQDPSPRSREGIWWLPNETATDYLVLTNQGSNALLLDVSIYDSAGREAKQKIDLPSRSSNRLSVRQLVRTNGLSGSYGGIKISVPVHGGAIDSLHVVFDENVSFSALLKMFDHDPRATLEERDYAHTHIWTLRAPMLALSHPDPVLAFPEGTVLWPQVFVRNTLGKPVNVNLRFGWRDASSTGKSLGPSLRLAPFETRRVDVGALQAANVLPKDANWSSVILTTDGMPDEVVAVAASYDETLRYGAQTPFSDQLAFKWVGSQWQYDAQHNSLITAGNGGLKPLQAAFTIFYNQGTQKYQLKQTLQPDEQMWIDVGKLIREHVPDENGNVLPADLASGSYQLNDLTNKGVGNVFEGKVIYDKTYGHVTYGCLGCCGYKGPHVWYSPLGIPFEGSTPQGVDATDTCSGLVEDVSDTFYGTWRSANTAIATVDYYASHTGVTLGSTSSNGSAYMQMMSIKPVCPNNLQSPGGSDSVEPKILLGGSNGTNVTGKTTSVVVGQQIVLYASYGSVTATSQSWSVPGTTVGGFTGTLTSGGPTSAVFNAQSTTFYWVTAGNSQTVTFTLNYGNSQTATAQTTFNVSGPSTPNVLVCGGNVGGSCTSTTALGTVNINPTNVLQLGGSTNNIGIQFTASATPPSGQSNNFVWYQIITNDTKVITKPSGSTQTCVAVTTPAGGLPYLDTEAPYGTTSTQDDQPFTGLDTTQFTELTRTFAATMYALWTPSAASGCTAGSACTIPVPLGYVTWQWYADAKYTGGAWTLLSSPTNSGASTFQASGSFPTNRGPVHDYENVGR